MGSCVCVYTCVCVRMCVCAPMHPIVSDRLCFSRCRTRRQIGTAWYYRRHLAHWHLHCSYSMLFHSVCGCLHDFAREPISASQLSAFGDAVDCVCMSACVFCDHAAIILCFPTAVSCVFVCLIWLLPQAHVFGSRECVVNLLLLSVCGDWPHTKFCRYLPNLNPWSVELVSTTHQTDLVHKDACPVMSCKVRVWACVRFSQSIGESPTLTKVTIAFISAIIVWLTRLASLGAWYFSVPMRTRPSL